MHTYEIYINGSYLGTIQANTMVRGEEMYGIVYSFKNGSDKVISILHENTERFKLDVKQMS